MNSKPSVPRPGVAFALGAAVLFGASTPFAKLLLGEANPILLAGPASPHFSPKMRDLDGSSKRK